MALRDPNKPRSYDLEIHFVLNGQKRFLYANVRACLVCKDLTVFQRACGLCGRYSPADKAVYFQIARPSPLSPIPSQTNEQLQGLEERLRGPAQIIIIAQGGDNDGEDRPPDGNAPSSA